MKVTVTQKQPIMATVTSNTGTKKIAYKRNSTANKSIVLASALSAVVAVIVYLNSLHGDFVFDDYPGEMFAIGKNHSPLNFYYVCKVLIFAYFILLIYKCTHTHLLFLILITFYPYKFTCLQCFILMFDFYLPMSC